jgi:hypothetical protein
MQNVLSIVSPTISGSVLANMKPFLTLVRSVVVRATKMTPALARVFLGKFTMSKIFVLGCLALAAAAARQYVFLTYRTNSLYTLIASKLSISHCWSLHQQFMSLPLQPAKPPVVSNPHGLCAAQRNQAYDFIDRAFAGYQQYCVSMSKRDERDGKDGDRQWHFLKDMSQRPRCDELKPDHVIVIVDTDYYFDLPTLNYWLTRGNPVVMYTKSPCTVAGTGPGFNFKFLEGNVCQWTIVNSQSFKHQLWQYNSDTITANTPLTTTVLRVDQRRLDDLNVLVYFEPMLTTFRGLVTQNPVQRLQVDNGSHNMLQVQDEDKLYVSLSAYASHTSVQLPLDTYDALVIRLQACYTKNPVMSMVERYLQHAEEFQQMDRRMIATAATIIFDRIIQGKQVITASMIKVKDLNRNYQTLYPLITEDGKDTMRTLFHPFVDEGFSPVSSYNNDTSCVEGRVYAPRDKPQQPSRAMRAYAQEFLELLIPTPHSLVPWTEEEFREQYETISQKSKYDDNCNWLWFFIQYINSFGKVEAYPTINFPRNISPHDEGYKVFYSLYMKAIGKLLSMQHWYGFLPPSEMEDKLHQKCIAAMRLREDIKVGPPLPGLSDLGVRAPHDTNDKLTEHQMGLLSDYSKMDGSIQPYIREFEAAVLRRAFPHDPVLEQLIENVQNIKGRTKHGVSYDTWSSRTSGSPDTSPFNSLCSALHAYCSYRLQGMLKHTAWHALGLYAGDDGFSPLMQPKAYEVVARQFGLHIKVTPFTTTSGITFLARHFTSPFEHKGNVTDVRRMVSKLHLTKYPDTMDVNLVYYRKATSILVTDGSTPFIRDWCVNILRITGLRGYETSYDDITYNVRLALREKAGDKLQGDWSHRFINHPIYTPPPINEMVDYVCSSLGITPIQLDEIVKQFTNSNNYYDMSMIEFPAEWTAKTQAALGHEILGEDKMGPGAKRGAPRNKAEKQQPAACKRMQDYKAPSSSTRKPVVKLPRV